MSNELLRESYLHLVEDYSAAIGSDAEKALNYEVKSILSYITASNMRVADGEAALINSLLGLKLDTEETAKFITANNIFSKQFETTIPQMFAKQIKNSELSAKYLHFIESAMKECIISDSSAEEEEIVAMNEYLWMLYKAYNENNPDNQLEYTPASIKDAASSFHYRDKSDAQEETLEELLDELNGLIGLESVKRNVYSLLHLQSIQMEREKRGISKIPMTNHLVFTGNPGTGKTTVARLIARIYYKIGLISTGTFVEVDRSGMVAGYVGQTAIEVKNVMDSAKGGVLFVDEAYSLAGGLPGDYGMEAIETMLKRMEDEREDMIVIVAGYPELMEKFIASNPGLRSRFSKKIHFPDYTPDELLEILKYMVKKHNLTISEEALALSLKVFTQKYENRTEHFANAREVRNYFESGVVSQADRLYGKLDLSDDELCRLEESDFKYNEIMIG